MGVYRTYYKLGFCLTVDSWLDGTTGYGYSFRVRGKRSAYYRHVSERQWRLFQHMRSVFSEELEKEERLAKRRLRYKQKAAETAKQTELSATDGMAGNSTHIKSVG
jgi:hypothetical protein